MDESERRSKRSGPRGAPPKGGSRFPRYGLKDATAWAIKLVSKTHLSPQSKDVVFAGVVSSKGSLAEIKVSALKQFGLLEGPSTAYDASALAKQIAARPEEERCSLYIKAAQIPPIFQDIFNTFQGDNDVPTSKIRQRAAGLKVHPDNLSECVKIYIASFEFAGLVTVKDDLVSHRPSVVNDTHDGNPEIVDSGITNENEGKDVQEDEKAAITRPREPGHQRAIINVSVTLDSSLDTDKLERQLALLKRFGAL